MSGRIGSSKISGMSFHEQPGLCALWSLYGRASKSGRNRPCKCFGFLQNTTQKGSCRLQDIHRQPWSLRCSSQEGARWVVAKKGLDEFQSVQSHGWLPERHPKPQFLLQIHLTLTRARTTSAKSLPRNTLIRLPRMQRLWQAQKSHASWHKAYSA